MKKIFINFTNHPSKDWEENQIKAARVYGEIVDVPFPIVEADCTETEVDQIAHRFCDKICAYKPVAVLCQGEFSLVYQVIRLLKDKGITVLAACSQRDVIEIKKEDGSIEKTAIFRFVRFREYKD